MKRQEMHACRLPVSVFLIGVTLLAAFPGCSAGKKEVPPQQKEEMRQKMIKNAERQKREG